MVSVSAGFPRRARLRYPRGMTEGKRRIDRILEPEFLRGVEQRSTNEVRVLRSDCSEEEALLSYERRILHGRLAILRAELDRRAGGGTSSIVDKLPEILADERRQSRGSFPSHDPHLYDRPSRRVSKLVTDDTLANLADHDDDAIRAHTREFEEAEREVSAQRRSVLDVLDALNRELARRYQSGEADPNDVLTGR